MHIAGIIPNLEKAESIAVLNEILKWLVENNIRPVVSHNVCELLSNKEYGVDSVSLFKTPELLIILGGDGTILNVAANAALYDIPLIGINLGTLGFLTDVEKDGATDALNKVFRADYITERRMMVDVSVNNKNLSRNIALNDVCITRGAFSRIIELHVYVNNYFLNTYVADGLIVSTPTGSTAYNLSAGGPILKPDSEMIAITPICPHNLNTRSVVISSNDSVKIKVGDNVSSDVHLSCDGQNVSPLSWGDIVTVVKSSLYTKIIKTNDIGFFDIVRKKIIGY